MTLKKKSRMSINDRSEKVNEPMIKRLRETKYYKIVSLNYAENEIKLSIIN